jgi:hypothetical protein
MYKRLKNGTHQLSITGPELADIAELVALLGRLDGDADLISMRLFHDLCFQKVFATGIKNSAEMETACEKVYKRAADGTFKLIFSDSTYYSIANLLLYAIDLRDDAELAGRKLFNALGFQEAFKAFMSSGEGRDIFMRSSPEEGHA